MKTDGFDEVRLIIFLAIAAFIFGVCEMLGRDLVRHFIEGSC